MSLFYLTALVIPRTVEQARTFFENLEFAAESVQRDDKEVGLIYNLGFDNRKDKRLWFMNRFSEQAWLAMGVNVHTRSEEGGKYIVSLQRRRIIDEALGYWVFQNGRELIIDPDTGDEFGLLPLRTRRSSTLARIRA